MSAVNVESVTMEKCTRSFKKKMNPEQEAARTDVRVHTHTRKLKRVCVRDLSHDGQPVLAIAGLTPAVNHLPCNTHTHVGYSCLMGTSN